MLLVSTDQGERCSGGSSKRADAFVNDFAFLNSNLAAFSSVPDDLHRKPGADEAAVQRHYTETYNRSDSDII
jgi:hypothetical protein